MMSSRTNLAAGIPSSKVKYSKLSSTDDGYIDLQVKSGEGEPFLLGRAAVALLLWCSPPAEQPHLREEQSCQPPRQPFSSRKHGAPSWEQIACWVGSEGLLWREEALGADLEAEDVNTGSDGGVSWAGLLPEGPVQARQQSCCTSLSPQLCQLWGSGPCRAGGDLCGVKLFNIGGFPPSSRRAHPKSPTRQLPWLLCSS